ncbi:hypothetical protein CLOM_g14431 [Closterium sp. NIES-68]|nr:hypothetical protein CLOM_g14431 [Closterium sp. NIES-68]
MSPSLPGLRMLSGRAANEHQGGQQEGGRQGNTTIANGWFKWRGGNRAPREEENQGGQQEGGPLPLLMDDRGCSITPPPHTTRAFPPGSGSGIIFGTGSSGAVVGITCTCTAFRLPFPFCMDPFHWSLPAATHSLSLSLFPPLPVPGRSLLPSPPCPAKVQGSANTCSANACSANACTPVAPSPAGSRLQAEQSCRAKYPPSSSSPCIHSPRISAFLAC